MEKIGLPAEAEEQKPHLQVFFDKQVSVICLHDTVFFFSVWLIPSNAIFYQTCTYIVLDETC